MSEQTQNETRQKTLNPQGYYSSTTSGFDAVQSRHDLLQPLAAMPEIMQSVEDEQLELAIGELRLGQRIQEELKRQGRSVTWLARQLGKERPGLYYIFRQNSIDVELLLRISFFLKHDFMRDIDEMYRANML